MGWFCIGGSGHTCLKCQLKIGKIIKSKEKFSRKITIFTKLYSHCVCVIIFHGNNTQGLLHTIEFILFKLIQFHIYYIYYM